MAPTSMVFAGIGRRAPTAGNAATDAVATTTRMTVSISAQYLLVDIDLIYVSAEEATIMKKVVLVGIGRHVSTAISVATDAVATATRMTVSTSALYLMVDIDLISVCEDNRWCIFMWLESNADCGESS